MHDFPYPIYLRTHRDRWTLSQSELAALLGDVSRSLVSKYELLARTPSVEAVVGSEFIFGEPARRIFPALYASIELGVTGRAALLAERLARRDDAVSLTKRQLLEAIAERAVSDAPTI